MDMTVGERPALQRRQCLPAAGDAPPEPQGADACAGDAHSCSRAGAPSGSSTRTAARRIACAWPRELILCGGPINSPQLLKLSGVGPGGGTARARHPGGARPAGRGREPAGSPGVLFPGGLQGADHAVLVHQSVEPRADRRALAAAQGWPRRHQSFRDLRLHPQPAGSSVSRHPVSLPADGGGLRWLDSGAGARLSGARRPDALARAAAGCGWSRPTRATSRASCSII